MENITITLREPKTPDEDMSAVFSETVRIVMKNPTYRITRKCCQAAPFDPDIDLNAILATGHTTGCKGGSGEPDILD